MSEEVTQKTIDLLSRVVKKTPLNHKLLAKPPFRYLHDLFTEVISTTGACAGLYSPEELKHETFKDKEGKVGYLTKIIECLQYATGVTIKANPLKIVAGMDPEDTNALIQILGKVALKKVILSDKVDTRAAVAKVLGLPEASEEPEKIEEEPAPVFERPKTSHSKNDLSASQLDEKPINPPADELRQRLEEPRAEKQSRTKSPAPQPLPIQPPPERQEESDQSADKQESPSQEEIPTDERTNRAMPQLSKRPQRPISARPPPPKLKQAEVVEPKVTNVIHIHKEDPKDDDDEFVVKAVHDAAEPAIINTNAGANDQHGGLVSKILQTKKQLEGTEVAEPKTKVETTTTALGIEDIVRIRESIQSLCQSTNPLGKSLDYLQEDVDAMNKELETWKRESENYALQEREQSKITEEALAPMKDKLSKIEKTVEEQIQRIESLKGTILINEISIDKLLKRNG